MTTRRDFLRNSAFLGAATMTAPLASAWGADAGAAPPVSPVSLVSPAGGTYTVHLRNMLSPRYTPRKINIPDVGGFKALKGDFHIHTLFSDGEVMPKDRVREAVNNGLDVIAITDHIEYRPHFSGKGKWKLTAEQADNYNLWYETALPEAEKQNLLLVRGAEITKGTMPPGHFNALFADDNNPIAAAVDDWRTMLKVAADHGAFLLWNHPGWEAPQSGGIPQGSPLWFTEAHEEVWRKGWMHGIEIFNGHEYYPVVSDWCSERNLAMLANSDIHPSEMKNYGYQNPLRPITIVLAKERSVIAVREAMFARRTIAWAAGMLWGSRQWLTALFQAAVDLKAITPGVLQLSNNSSLPITVAIGGATVELPENGRREVFHAPDLAEITVTNWMVGSGEALRVAI